jgi:hypothetical protein
MVSGGPRVSQFHYHEPLRGYKDQRKLRAQNERNERSVCGDSDSFSNIGWISRQNAVVHSDTGIPDQQS